MRKLDRYLAREMILPFLIGTVIVVLMFQANQMIALYKDPNINMQRIPFATVMQLLLYKTPFWLQMTLPVGVALGASLSVARITRESELTAMRSAGIPIRRVLLPVIGAGILAAGVNWTFTERIMPPAEKRASKLLIDMGQVAIGPTIKSNFSISLQGWIVNIGMVAKGTGTALRLENVTLNQKDPTGEEIFIRAKTGSYDEGIWTFDQPEVRVFKDKNFVQILPRDKMTINQRIAIEDFLGSVTAEQKTVEQLAESIKDAKRANIDTRYLEVEYHLRYSLPASCLVFALTGSVLAIYFSRSGPFVGVMLSLILVMLYYNAFIIAKEIVGRNGYLSPVLSAWLPNAVFLCIGLLILRKTE